MTLSLLSLLYAFLYFFTSASFCKDNGHNESVCQPKVTLLNVLSSIKYYNLFPINFHFNWDEKDALLYMAVDSLSPSHLLESGPPVKQDFLNQSPSLLNRSSGPLDDIAETLSGWWSRWSLLRKMMQIHIVTVKGSGLKSDYSDRGPRKGMISTWNWSRSLIVHFKFVNICTRLSKIFKNQWRCP